MDLNLGGRIALVVGGGRGIGKACALALAREGADVALLSRTSNELESTAAEVRAHGHRALALAADATDFVAVDQALQRVQNELGAPAILILGAAALFAPHKLQNVSDAEAAHFLSVDLASAVSLCTRVLPGMMDARFGRIVALGSLAARTGISGGTIYCATKSALEGLCRGIALDYSRRGITANTLALGFVETERLRERLGGDPDARARLERSTATRLITTPAQAADVVAFLCSPLAAAITGAVIDVTSGAHLNNLW